MLFLDLSKHIDNLTRLNKKALINEQYDDFFREYNKCFYLICSQYIKSIHFPFPISQCFFDVYNDCSRKISTFTNYRDMFLLVIIIDLLYKEKHINFLTYKQLIEEASTCFFYKKPKLIDRAYKYMLIKTKISVLHNNQNTEYREKVKQLKTGIEAIWDENLYCYLSINCFHKYFHKQNWTINAFSLSQQKTRFLISNSKTLINQYFCKKYDHKHNYEFNFLYHLIMCGGFLEKEQALQCCKSINQRYINSVIVYYKIFYENQNIVYDLLLCLL